MRSRWQLVGMCATVAVVGCGPRPDAQEPRAVVAVEQVRVRLPGVPAFHAPREAMRGRLGAIVRAMRAALEVQPPAEPPAAQAPEEARKAWLAGEYLPYVQTHTAAYGRVVQELGDPEELSADQQVFVMALLGWMEERAARVTARVRSPETLGVETDGELFEAAQSHYRACAELAEDERKILQDEAARRAAVSTSPAVDPRQLARWSRFCRERLQELPDVHGQDGAQGAGGEACDARSKAIAERLGAAERDRHGPPPEWVRLPSAHGAPLDDAEDAGAQDPPGAPFHISIGGDWVAFRSFRARTTADATPETMEARLARHAEYRQRLAGSDRFEMLVFADADVPMSTLGPLLTAARRVGPVWLALALDEETAPNTPEGRDEPDWYGPWRTSWAESPDRHVRLHLLRQAWETLLAGCPTASEGLHAMAAASGEQRWRMVTRVVAPREPSPCACEASGSPLYGPLIDLTIDLLRGPRTVRWPVEGDRPPDPPAEPDPTLDTWVRALAKADPPVRGRIPILPEWQEHPES